jgi:serine/threonine-protein kinase
MAETLGPYTLDKRIGSGGMADVFLARGPRGVCVVKRPHPHLCANPDFVRMFLDEASILASVHHPNIAEIFDLGQVNGAFYLAMEYVPGFDLMTISLEHERQGELMAPELCARIIADVAGALHSAHEAKHPKTGQPLNLIHRDVTPHNVLLSTTGIVKLIDFGVARAATATHRTQAGLVKGKYPYMAPEQITGQDIDRRVDVYALGLVLYELLTNTRAIAGNTEVEQIDNARASRIRPIEQLRPNLAMPLRQILASCVHPDRDGRYPTALALKEDLEKYLRYVGQPIGQEDLLRLFRVVAAEVAHLEPGTPPQMSASAAQNTWGGARTEQEIPSDPAALSAEEAALGFAPTSPSMRMPALPQANQPPGPPVPEPQPTEPQLPVSNPAKPLPPKLQSTAIIGDRKKFQEVVDAAELDTIPAPPSTGMGKWLVLGGAALIVVIAGVLLLKPRPIEPSGPTDAGVALVQPAVIDAGAVAEAVLDAGGPDVVVDAGEAAVALAEPDAGAPHDDRAAVVKVVSDVPMAVSAEGHNYGGTPARLELEPGKHTITARNLDLGCSQTFEVELEPGANEVRKLVNPRGKLTLKVEPLGDFSVNGRKVAGGMSAVKDVTLCDGTYTIKVEFSGLSKTKRVQVTANSAQVVDFGPLSAP